MDEINQEVNTLTLGNTFLDILAVLTKYRRFLVWFIICVTFIVTLIAFVSPKWYKATASVFPADQTDLFSGFDGISSLVKTFSPGGKFASLTRPAESERYKAILKSENAVMKVIEKFDLTKVYNITNYPREKTIKVLLSNVNFGITDEGALEIIVYDKNPKLAASMANYFVDILNEINAQLHVQNAKGNREFIEQRYNKNLTDIRVAEENLKSFQLKHGVIAISEQMEASIKTNAEIFGMLTGKEIELSVLKHTLSEFHPNLIKIQTEIDEIKRKLKEMESGTNVSPEEMKILVPLRQAPKLTMDFYRLYRDVEIQYKILQFIMPLYEQAKVEEKRNTPSVVVLDKASVPEQKARPKISLYFMLSFTLSSIVAGFVVFFYEGVKKIRASNPNKFNDLWSRVRSDWFGLRWKQTKR